MVLDVWVDLNIYIEIQTPLSAVRLFHAGQAKNIQTENSTQCWVFRIYIRAMYVVRPVLLADIAHTLRMYNTLGGKTERGPS